MKYKFIDAGGEHLHTLDGKPLIGTSTVTQIIAKPLTWWASGLAVAELGWLNSKTSTPDERREAAEKMQNEIVGMPVEEYIALLDKAYAAHSKTLKTSAVKGTDMHAELEKYVKWCMEGEHTEPYKTDNVFVKQFSTWALENIDEFLVSEGHVFDEELWTGGILDVMARKKSGRIAILDFKSSKEAYASQFIQIGGYDIAQSRNGVVDKDGVQILKPQKVDEYIVVPFGAAIFEPDIRLKPNGFMDGFKSALQLHKLINIK